MRQRSLIALLVGLCLVAFVGLSRADDEKKKDDEKKPAPTAKKGYLGIRFEIEEGKGAVIQEIMPSSPAEKAGLKVGDVIVKVGKTEVKDEDTLRESVGDMKPGDKLTVVLKRDGKEQTMDVTVGEKPEDND
jgi:S1-C subfamily serine protease